MSRTVENQFFQKASLLRAFERDCGLNWDDQRLSTLMGRPSAPARARNFEDSVTHWNEPSSFCSFSVSHKDHAVLPIQVLDAHPEEFSCRLSPHVAHQDDNIAEKFARFAVAACKRKLCYEFPFRFVVKSKMPSMLLQHCHSLQRRSHLPLFPYIQHSSMFVEHSWHLRLNREISSARRSHP